jgi:hypothetical protein
MEPTRFTLCTHCTECPEVEITTDQSVRIGEGDNSVHLSRDSWSELVRLIKAGQPREMWRQREGAAVKAAPLKFSK